MKITYLDLNNPVVRESNSQSTLNLGALYILSALEKNLVDVEYRDYQLHSPCELSIDEIVKWGQSDTDIILVCCMAYMLPLVTAALQRMKKNNPNKKIILGGAGPTGVARELLEAFDCIDMVIKGEGEETISEVMNCLREAGEWNNAFLERLKAVDGLVYANDGAIIVTKNRARISDLDALGFPAYHLVDMSRYENFGIITGRGCAYRCKFCDIHGIWGRKYFERSLENVIDEISLLYNEYGIRNINIWDDTFTMREARVVEFCNMLKERNIEITWTCFARVNRVSQKLISTMAASGCIGVFYGLESGSEEILRRVDKKIDISQMIDSIEMTLKYIPVKGHFIWGFPFESEEELYKTIYLYNYLQTKIQVDVSQLWPYPTSPLYVEHKDCVRFDERIGIIDKLLPFKPQYASDRFEVVGLIEKHPEIFVQFYYYHTSNFEERFDIVSRLSGLKGA